MYARISLDRREGEGVARQLDLCRTLADERGWEVVAEFVDNSVSAYQDRVRPQWVKLLRDLQAGVYEAVVAYHPDRLYRRLPDLEGLIDVIEQHGVKVATVRAGDLDLSTAAGRMNARILGAVARGESERTAERVRDAKARNARAGRPSNGGGRAFGFEDDRRTHRPDEAELIRGIAERLVAGSAFTAEVRALNDAGIRTPAGNLWRHASLRRVLTSERVAGLRAYRGELVAVGDWEPIVDRETWDLLRALMASRKRGRPRSGVWLLSGILACAECGGPMYAMPDARGHRYRCHPDTVSKTRHGCGKVTIRCDLADEYVEQVVGKWVGTPEGVEATGAAMTEPSDDRAERDDLERRMTRLSLRWADGKLGDEEYEQAHDVLVARRREVEARMAGALVQSGPVDRAVLARAWARGDVPSKREVIEGLAVTPLPVRRGVVDGRRLSAEERITVEPA